MSQRNVLIAGRLFFGLLTLVAIGAQQVTSMRLGLFNPVTFFSYFTNLSNIFAAIVFLVGGVMLLRRREPTVIEETIRGASVLAMTVVGIVFSVLLRNEDLGALLPWVNAVVHYIMPVVVVADWLYQPPRAVMGLRQLGNWLIYPLLYVSYTLIRGAIVKFYPYPFLNPARVGGYGGVALYCVGILALFVIGGGILIWLGNQLRRQVVASYARAAALGD